MPRNLVDQPVAIDRIVKEIDERMKKGILLILMVLLCGCGTPESEKAVLESSQSEKADTAKLQEEETLWAVLDHDENTVGYLAEDDKNVVQIKELIENHCNYVDNRSADNLPIEKEMQLYTEEFRTLLEESGYTESVQDMYKGNQLALEKKQILWCPNTFDEELKYGKITVDAQFLLTKGDEGYLKQHEMSLDTIYIEQRVYYLEKTDGNWKISNINKSALDQYNPT